jgi:hypothetical protein
MHLKHIMNTSPEHATIKTMGGKEKNQHDLSYTLLQVYPYAEANTFTKSHEFKKMKC